MEKEKYKNKENKKDKKEETVDNKRKTRGRQKSTVNNLYVLPVQEKPAKR